MDDQRRQLATEVNKAAFASMGVLFVGTPKDETRIRRSSIVIARQSSLLEKNVIKVVKRLKILTATVNDIKKILSSKAELPAQISLIKSVIASQGNAYKFAEMKQEELNGLAVPSAVKSAGVATLGVLDALFSGFLLAMPLFFKPFRDYITGFFTGFIDELKKSSKTFNTWLPVIAASAVAIAGFFSYKALQPFFLMFTKLKELGQVLGLISSRNIAVGDQLVQLDRMLKMEGTLREADMQKRFYRDQKAMRLISLREHDRWYKSLSNKDKAAWRTYYLDVRKKRVGELNKLDTDYQRRRSDIIKKDGGLTQEGMDRREARKKQANRLKKIKQLKSVKGLVRLLTFPLKISLVGYLAGVGIDAMIGTLLDMFSLALDDEAGDFNAVNILKTVVNNIIGSATFGIVNNVLEIKKPKVAEINTIKDKADYLDELNKKQNKAPNKDLTPDDIKKLPFQNVLGSTPVPNNNSTGVEIKQASVNVMVLDVPEDINNNIIIVDNTSTIFNNYQVNRGTGITSYSQAVGV